jgi:hypothetical protein
MTDDLKLKLPNDLRFASVGQCIYCGRTMPEVNRLTEEHIIPYSFGGHMILPDASCDDCMVITGKACNQVCRLMLNPVRWHNGLPSRKKKEREKTIRIGVGDDGDVVHQEFHHTVAPAIVGFPLFEPAGLFSGKPLEGGKIRLDGFQMAVTSPDHETHERNLKAAGVEKPTFSTECPLDEFMRILAQIGHGYIVSQQGYREDLPLADIVTGKNPNISHFIGGTPPEMNFLRDPQSGVALHQLRPFAACIDGVGYLALQIRLFSYLTPSPVYTVITSTWTIAKGDEYLFFERNDDSDNVRVTLQVMT